MTTHYFCDETTRQQYIQYSNIILQGAGMTILKCNMHSRATTVNISETLKRQQRKKAGVHKKMSLPVSQRETNLKNV